MDADIAAAFPALAKLDIESSRILEQGLRPVDIPAGTVLFRDGADCANYLLVQEGAVRVQKVAENGREIVLYRVERGQSCVLTTNCLLGGGLYAAEGIAETEVRALVLPASVFRGLLAGSADFRDFIFSVYAARIADLLLLIEEVAFGRIDVRLAAWVRGRAGDGQDVLATHQEISVELGTAREVVSRQLKEFERRGWVQLHRGRVRVIDAAAMDRLGR